MDTLDRKPSERKAADKAWADRTWPSADGLTLHFRDYPGDAGAVPVVILHGLTRNARDAAPLAEKLARAARVQVGDMFS